MKARTRAVIDGDRLVELCCEPPLTLRRVHGEIGTCALCLVATAAGPLAGDDLGLDLDLRPGAHASLCAAGAMIAQGTGGARSVRTAVRLAAGARLTADPGALIVAQGCRVDVAISIELAADAALDWTEVIVLGRSAEPPGAATLRWDVMRAGRPLLRQFVDLADPVLSVWAGMANRARVLHTRLISDPAISAVTTVHSPTAVTARLDDHTTLTTVLDPHPLSVSSRHADSRAANERARAR